MAVEKILLEFDAEIKGLRQDLNQVKSQLGDVDKKVEQSGSRMTSTFKNVGKAIAAAFSVQVLIQFTKKAVELYDIQAKAEASLLQALKGRTDVQQRLIKQAQDLQKVTLFGDEATIQAQAMLAKFGMTEEAITRLIPLIQDYATISGQDLVSAADMVARSVGTSTNALTRYGIEIEGAVGSSERLDSAVESLTEQFAGQAEVAAQAGAGALQQFQNTWGDFAEMIGAKVLPGLEKVIQSFLFVGRQLSTVTDDFEENTDAQLNNLDASVKETKQLQSLIDRYDELSDKTDKNSDDRNELNRIMIEMQAQFGENVIQINKETGALEINRAEIVKQMKIRANANSALAQELLQKRNQLELTIAQSRAMFDLTYEQREFNDLKGQEAIDFQVSQFAYRQAKEELIELDEKLAALGITLEDLVVNPLNLTTKATKEFTKANLNLSESFDEMPKKLYDNWLAWVEQKTALDRLKESADDVVDTNLDEFVTRLNDALSEADAENITFFSNIADGLSLIDKQIIALGALSNVFGNYSVLLREVAEDQSAYAEFAKTLAMFSIGINQAEAIAGAVKVVSTSAKSPLDYFVFLSSLLSSIAVTIGNAKQTIEQFQTPKAAFAEGVVDLKGKGTETSDSINARLSRGESVITAKGTRQDKGLFEAANKLQLEEYINKNYVLPALVKVQKDKADMFDDYRLYRALKDGQRQDRELNKELIRQMGRRYKRYDWN